MWVDFHISNSWDLYRQLMSKFWLLLLNLDIQHFLMSCVANTLAWNHQPFWNFALTQGPSKVNKKSFCFAKESDNYLYNKSSFRSSNNGIKQGDMQCFVDELASLLYWCHSEWLSISQKVSDHTIIHFRYTLQYVVSNCSDCKKLRMQESVGGAWVADRILIIRGQG